MVRAAVPARDQQDAIDTGAKRVIDRMAEPNAILLPTWQSDEVPGFRIEMQRYLYHAQAARITRTYQTWLILEARRRTS